MSYTEYGPQTVLPVKIVRGWRRGVIVRRIKHWTDQGYVLQGPIQSVDIGRRYMATLVKPS